MKKVLIGLVLSTWVALIAGQLTWDVTSTDPKAYTTLLEQVRNKLKGSNKCFDIPMMGATPDPPSYITIKLIGEENKDIILALNKSNSYVVGYSDIYNNKARALFLRDAPPNAKDKAFPDAKKANQVEIMPYGSSYQELEKNGGPKSSLSLTRATLLSRLKKIFGVKDIKDREFIKNQAQFFLLAVQMVSEATRFKYIEDKVAQNLDAGYFVPDSTMQTIVNQWGVISTAIEKADKNGKFQNPFTVGGEMVTKVDDVRKYISLLMYIKDPKCGKAKLIILYQITYQLPAFLSYMQA